MLMISTNFPYDLAGKLKYFPEDILRSRKNFRKGLPYFYERNIW